MSTYGLSEPELMLLQSLDPIEKLTTEALAQRAAAVFGPDRRVTRGFCRKVLRHLNRTGFVHTNESKPERWLRISRGSAALFLAENE